MVYSFFAHLGNTCVLYALMGVSQDRGNTTSAVSSCFVNGANRQKSQVFLAVAKPTGLVDINVLSSSSSSFFLNQSPSEARGLR